MRMPQIPVRAGALHRRSIVVGLVALLGDVVLITASVLHRIVAADGPLGFLSLGRWNGNRDGTFVELWGGVQLVVAAVALLALLMTLRGAGRPGADYAVYGAWAAVILTVALDDYLMIHERLGAVLVDALHIPRAFGLRPQDFGELLVWAVIAAVLGLLLVVAHVRAPRQDRRNSLVFLALMGFLAAFGVVLDMLNIMLHPVLGEGMLTVTTHLETGGELVAMTLLLVWAVHLLDEGRAAHAQGRRGTEATPFQRASL